MTSTISWPPDGRIQTVAMVNNDHLMPLFQAATEAVGEAIVNALLAAGAEDVEHGQGVTGLQAQVLLAALTECGWRAR